MSLQKVDQICLCFVAGKILSSLSMEIYMVVGISMYIERVCYPFKDEAQTALFKDPVRTAQ